MNKIDFNKKEVFLGLIGIFTLTLQSMLPDSIRWAVLGNHLTVDIPLVCPFHVNMCALGRKHLSGGVSLLRLTPSSCGAHRKFLP